MQENMLETPEQTNTQTKAWQWDLGSVAEWLPIRKDAGESGWYSSTFLFVLPKGPFFLFYLIFLMDILHSPEWLPGIENPKGYCPLS